MTYHCPDWVYDADDPNGEDASYFYSIWRCTRFREPSEVIVNIHGETIERPDHDGGNITTATCDRHEIDSEWDNSTDPWREDLQHKEWVICDDCDQIYASTSWLEDHWEESHSEENEARTSYATGAVSTHASWYSYTNG